MNKRRVFKIFAVIFVFLLVIGGFILKNISENPAVKYSNKNVVKRVLKNDNSDEGRLAEVNKNINKVTVEDKETAIKIAEMVFEQVFKESKNDNKPYEVEYYDKDNVWLVEGTLAPNMVGGVPYVIIRKSDSKILGVWHTK